MSELFLKILNMSLVSSMLIVALIVLRPLLKKAPRALNCALWALVGIRLVCPFTFESFLSLIPDPEPVRLFSLTYIIICVTIAIECN